jgi:NAD(P)-dependent dehydrogenase (short-subunit alcohol dehydrogenase family)
MASSTLRQRSRSLRCPPGLTLDGKVALVTGGNKGIGAAVADALVTRGADIVVAARDVGALAPGRHPVPMDLADLDAVVRATDALLDWLRPRTLDVVVLNAGVLPRRVTNSAQGYELAFAVNVLGHHVLLQRLLAAGALTTGCRVVVVTGDIQVFARDCTPDYASTKPWAGVMAYCRSKLGTSWLAAEDARRRPELHVVAVHPGVVDSGLGLRNAAAAAVRRWTRISPALSAETVLYAATQPDVVSGGYLHNTLGLLDLPPTEPAGDAERARAFLDRLDELAKPFV